MEAIDWGVCRLSLVPVRKLAADSAEQVTQLLFGDHYEVIEVDASGKWLRIRIVFDDYEGWMDSKQHHAVSKEYFLYSNKAEFKITVDLTASILYNKSALPILMGSIIPISSSELFRMEEQFAFNGEAKNLGLKREFEFLKTIATRYLNSPYQWGGKSPFGIDCSGFVQMVFKICGYKLLRDTSQQCNQGKLIDDIARCHPGDLAFFKDSSEKINHVGILLNSGSIIHSSGKVRLDNMTPDGIPNPDTKVLSHTLASIRRIIPEVN